MASDYQHLNYRGMDDLQLAVQQVALQLPEDLDLVVGIPRSGLLAASMLALMLNLPMADLGGYVEGRVLATGRRPGRDTGDAGRRRRVVVIDDSVLTGGAMDEARELLASSGDELFFAAPYVTREGRTRVDVFGEVLDPPRIFAWNVMHHPTLMSRACLDIDGVLCLDPLPVQNDDATAYRQFLVEAQPLFLPTSPVGYLVTSRLEKYRAETEAWLARHAIQYGELVMLDLPDAASRQRLGAHAGHKADFYASSDAELFVESEFPQAVAIAARSGRQVFSIDRRQMVYPTLRQAAGSAPGELTRSILRPPAQQLSVALRAQARRVGAGRLVHAARRVRGH